MTLFIKKNATPSPSIAQKTTDEASEQRAPSSESAAPATPAPTPPARPGLQNTPAIATPPPAPANPQSADDAENDRMQREREEQERERQIAEDAARRYQAAPAQEAVDLPSPDSGFPALPPPLSDPGLEPQQHDIAPPQPVPME